MSNPVLKLGDKNVAVKKLHKLLNEKVPDSDLDPKQTLFDEDTDAAVRSYQQNAHLKSDGVVGPMTWAALEGTESFVRYTNTRLWGQPTSGTCWKAATCMLLEGKSGAPANPVFVTAGPALTEVNLIGFGGLENSHENMQKFADHHRLKLLRQPNMTCHMLVDMLRQFGRVMLNSRQATSTGGGGASDSHFVTVIGARGNGQPGGTTLAIMDPSPVGFGQELWDSYSGWKSRNPDMYYQVLYRA